ncbi:MAG: winged helix-turn-helix transcriptional regulator [Eubacteriales bacterium]
MKKPIGAKPGDLRRQNYQAILQLFRDKDQLAVRDIMEVVSLSKTAITNILTNLIEMGTIHSMGKAIPPRREGKSRSFMH